MTNEMRFMEWVVKNQGGTEIARRYAHGIDLPTVGQQVLVDYNNTTYTVNIDSVQMKAAVLDAEFQFLNFPGLVSIFWVVTCTIVP